MLHFSGDLTPDERVQVLLRFREGAERVLICTNVLARGIDVDSVRTKLAIGLYLVAFLMPINTRILMFLELPLAE